MKSYSDLEKLASGGMGEVYLAKVKGAKDFERKVAIKFLKKDLVREPSAQRAFSREAKVLSNLYHPNIVGVIDFDVADSGVPFLVMQYVDGQTLEAFMQRQSEVDVDASLHVIQSVLLALNYAHTLVDDQGRHCGVVHRDIKPSNIFITPSQQVLLADFGLAKPIVRDDNPITQQRSAKGTFPYMSPELLRGLPLDARSDLFSLGVVFWELLAGQRLFGRQGLFTCQHVLQLSENRPIPHLRELDSELPFEVCDLVAELVQLEPNDRPADAQETLTKLKNLGLIFQSPQFATSQEARDELSFGHSISIELSALSEPSTKNQRGPETRQSKRPPPKTIAPREDASTKLLDTKIRSRSDDRLVPRTSKSSPFVGEGIVLLLGLLGILLGFAVLDHLMFPDSALIFEISPAESAHANRYRASRYVPREPEPERSTGKQRIGTSSKRAGLKVRHRIVESVNADWTKKYYLKTYKKALACFEKLHRALRPPLVYQVVHSIHGGSLVFHEVNHVESKAVISLHRGTWKMHRCIGFPEREVIKAPHLHELLKYELYVP